MEDRRTQYRKSSQREFSGRLWGQRVDTPINLGNIVVKTDGWAFGRASSRGPPVPACTCVSARTGRYVLFSWVALSSPLTLEPKDSEFGIGLTTLRKTPIFPQRLSVPLAAVAPSVLGLAPKLLALPAGELPLSPIGSAGGVLWGGNVKVCSP